jgi:hypothetical protein
MNRTLPLLGLGVLVTLRAAAGGDELTTKEISAARRVYVMKCAKCHRFYEPTNYAETDWRKWLDKMARKSRLKPEQEALLARYLDAYRAGRLPHKPEKRPLRPPE